MKTCKLYILIQILIIVVVLSACADSSPRMSSGYYKAEAADFDAYGWKEFVTIYVRDGRILTVEYDAFNLSGFVKSWDLSYMRDMRRVAGTHPKKYTRAYTVMLISGQSPDAVDPIEGAERLHTSFTMLAEAAMRQAENGDKQVALVALPEIQDRAEG